MQLSKIHDARSRCGGDGRDRTGDLLLAKQALSQLSYIPRAVDGGPKWARTTDTRLIKTVLYQLSYGPTRPAQPALRIKDLGIASDPEPSPGRAGGFQSRRRAETRGEIRKEVIQPHLPVRLPCYDLAPLTSRTFDGALPCGLSYRLRVQPTQVA